MTVANRIYDVLHGSRKWTVEHGDCRALLRLLPDACIDAVVTDPPYELAFMGRGWDRTGVAFDVEMWREAFRVCKPGAHIVSFGGTRTYHRMACAIEDAGFAMRDQIDWLYGEGMPKGQNISKAIDKAAGAKRKVVGQRVLTGNAAMSTKEKGGTYGARTDARGVPPKVVDVTEAATEEAKRWEGWGTGLKPAHEPIAMAMKPIEGTFRENVLRYGVGPIHVDACRIGTVEDRGRKRGTFPHSDDSWGNGHLTHTESHPTGRWPANLLLSHAESCRLTGTRKIKAAPPWNDNRPPSAFTGSETSPVHHAAADGTETVEAWECVEWCPVATLDAQAGHRKSGCFPEGVTYDRSRGTCYGEFAHVSTRIHGDEGSASRYFTQFPFEPFIYEPKATTSERERGLEWLDGDAGDSDRKNTHTTVKPVKVVRWLSRLVCPTGGLILDPFGGSGTGGIAALAEGMRWIGFELLREHVEIARARIIGDAPLLNLAGMGGSK